MKTNQIRLAYETKPTNRDQLLEVLNQLIPGVKIDEDKNGEVIIRTGLMLTGRETFEEWQER